VDVKVRSSNWKIALAFSAAAVVWLGLSTTLFALKLADGMQFGCAFFFLGFFVLFGLLLAVWAISHVFRWLRFGDSELEFAEEAAYTGRELTALLHFGRAFRPRGEMVLNPRCIRHEVHRYGGRAHSQSSNVTVLWRDEKTVRIDSAAIRSPVPISVDLPVGLPSASPPGSAGGIHWQLEVTVPAGFIDYHATFELPVQRGGRGVH
jgi:hypothetical protein